MDAFFASVEERDKPRLKGRPIVVGADPKEGRGRGVVSTANYLARKYGIRSALPISIAWRYAQKAKADGLNVAFMTPDIKRYQKTSREIMEYLSKQGDAFQVASVDEAYLELEKAKSYKDAEKLAQKIQKWMKTKERLTCSIGVGPNKLIAKICSDEKKPDGLTIVKDKDVQNFLDPKPVDVIPGIGPKAKQALANQKIFTIKDLRHKKKEDLAKDFGKRGGDWYYLSRGESDSPVEMSDEQKSIGEQVTFQKDTLDPAKIVLTMKDLSKNLSLALKKEKTKARTISIMVRFENFVTKTRSRTIKKSTNDFETIENEALHLLLPFLDSRENPKRFKIRLIGLRGEKLE